MHISKLIIFRRSYQMWFYQCALFVNTEKLSIKRSHAAFLNQFTTPVAVIDFNTLHNHRLLLMNLPATFTTTIAEIHSNRLKLHSTIVSMHAFLMHSRVSIALSLLHHRSTSTYNISLDFTLRSPQLHSHSRSSMHHQTQSSFTAVARSTVVSRHNTFACGWGLWWREIALKKEKSLKHLISLQLTLWASLHSFPLNRWINSLPEFTCKKLNSMLNRL